MCPLSLEIKLKLLNNLSPPGKLLLLYIIYYLGHIMSEFVSFLYWYAAQIPTHRL